MLKKILNLSRKILQKTLVVMGSSVQSSKKTPHLCEDFYTCKDGKNIQYPTKSSTQSLSMSQYSIRHVYNKNYDPKVVDNLLVRPLSDS